MCHDRLVGPGAALVVDSELDMIMMRGALVERVMPPVVIPKDSGVNP